MGSRRSRRKKLTTLLTDVNTRIRNVELRSTSQQAADAGSGETDETFVTPGSFLSSIAPSTWKKVIAGFYYSKQVTGLENDRVELFLNVDAGLVVDEFLEVSGINSPIEVSKKRKVLGTGQVVGTYRTNNAWFSAVPAGATHALLYSLGAEPGFTNSRALKTKVVIYSFSATTEVATIVFGETHSFNAGDVIDVSELGGSMSGIDGLFIVDTVPSSTSITYKFSSPIAASIASTLATANKFVYATVHEYVELGDSWINTSTTPDSLFVWDGIRWIAASDPSSVKKDDLDPKPPTSLNVETVAYPNETGFSRASATFSWTAPTQNTDDSALTDLAGYDIEWASPTVTGAAGDKWASAGGYTFIATTIDIPDLPSGQEVQFRVRAIDTGGRKSTYASITKLMGNRGTILLAPSAPVVTTRLGTVIVRWNGLQADTSVPPLFLDYIEVHVGSTSNFTPSSNTLQGKIDKTGNDFFIITDLDYNALRYVRLIFVDQAGNKNAPSAQAQVTIKPLVDADLIAARVNAPLSEWPFASGAVTPGSLATGAINNSNLFGESVVVQNAIAANAIGATQIAANAVVAGKIAANAVTASEIAADSITATKIATNAVTADKINAGAITTVKLDALAITAEKIAANTITATQIASGTITATQIASGTITATQIAANTITAEKIAANTITATQISSSYVYAGTISASNITAGTITGGSSSASFFIQSADGSSFLDVFNNHARIRGGSATVQCNDSTILLSGFIEAVGSLRVSSSVFFIGISAATTNTANMRRNQGGSGEVVVTNQSSIRFKKDVVNLISLEEIDPKKLLDLPVRAFKYKDEYPISPNDSRYQKFIPGFIAEEVEEFYPIGADYEDTKNGVVESWNERILVPGMLALIQELYVRIETLENGAN